MEELPDPPAPSMLDRREMIRKSALVGGGLVWGVPLVKSIHVDGAQGSQTNTCCNFHCAPPTVGPTDLDSCQKNLGSEADCVAYADSFCADRDEISVTPTFSLCPANSAATCFPGESRRCFCAD